MNGFPIVLVAAISVALLLLALAGIFLWKNMFASESGYEAKKQCQEEPPKSPEPEYSGQFVDNAESLNPITVSAADTISNNIDEDVVELSKRPLSSEQTVENAGDVSISNDDEEE